MYHKVKWQVETYIDDGPLKDGWLTTMVSSPEPLGSSLCRASIQFCFEMNENLVELN